MVPGNIPTSKVFLRKVGAKLEFSEEGGRGDHNCFHNLIIFFNLMNFIHGCLLFYI